MIREIKIVNSDKVATVDDWNFDRLSVYKWYLGDGVVSRAEWRNPKLFRISLACDVMNVFGVIFDHKDRNFLNNLESNLRRSTYSQNSANQKKRAGGTSKYKGVYWCKVKRKWLAKATMNYTGFFLGSFDNELLAALAYDKKHRELFGEFANPNFEIT